MSGLKLEAALEEALSEGGTKKKKGLNIVEIVRKIIADEGEGKLAQVGPSVYKDTQSEQGFVDYTNDIERKACLMAGRCARKAGVMSTLESFIAVPQATAYKATPYFFWRTLSSEDYDEDTRFVNSHWEPVNMAPSCIVFTDGVLDLSTDTFKQWGEIGHCLYGPKVMLPYATVHTAPSTPKFEEFLGTLKLVLPDIEARRYFQKMMGSILRPHVNIKKALFIQGPAGSRKSTVATAILCAPAGVGGFSIEEIDTLANKAFRQSNLIGRWANLSDDPDGRADKWVGWFKRYTGSSIMTGEFKYHQSRNYPITAKLVVCCNAIPKMGDSSDAVWSRLCVFRFDRTGEMESQFSDDTADNTKLNAEYWCDVDTRAAMCRWLLEGVRDGLLNGMTAPAVVKQWNSVACGEADPVRAFLLDEYTKGEKSDFVPYSEIRATLESAGHVISSVHVAHYLRTLFNCETDRKSCKDRDGAAMTVRGYSGIRKVD
jgi:hypothetical protein